MAAEIPVAGWIEIPVSDMARGMSFYVQVLGVQLRHMDLGGFQMALFPDLAVGMALCWGQSYVPSRDGLVVYLQVVDDLNAVLDRVVAAGGEVLIGKRLIAPGLGYMALFVDSEGNRIGLRSPN